jgi:hypothetical protein
MSEFKIAKVLNDMVAGPAGEAVDQNMYRSEDGTLHAYGTVVPVNGTADYAESCIFHKIGGSGSSLLYVNRGSDTSSLFTALGTAAYGTTTGRGPSPDIWDDCPVDEFNNNAEAGMVFFDDFIDGVDIATNLATAAASALGTTGKWTGATDTTANSVATLATDKKGAVVLSNDTDNESSIIAYPKGAQVAGKFSFVSGKKLWMEARLQVSSIADTISQIFVGFAEEGLVVGGTLLTIDEGGLADKDYVGFVREYADGDAMNTDFNTESGGASPQSNSNAVTLAATTYTKIGIYFDGTTVTFYQDGVALSDTFAITDTDFPVGEELAFYAENMCGAAGTLNTVTLDWVRIAQEY